jgi:hypothetical protein
MKIKYKEDPAAWRLSTLLSAGGLLLLSSLLRWRHVLPARTFDGILIALVAVATLAFLRPRWFRGYYRFSTWAGFYSSQAVAWLILALIFGVVFVPAGIILRLLGKDPLHLKQSRATPSYWRPAKPAGSLDRLF